MEPTKLNREYSFKFGVNWQDWRFILQSEEISLKSEKVLSTLFNLQKIDSVIQIQNKDRVFFVFFLWTEASLF